MVYSYHYDCMRFLWIRHHFRRVLNLDSVALFAHLHLDISATRFVQGTLVTYGENVKSKLFCVSTCKKHWKFMVLKSKPTITLPIDTIQLWRILCKILLPNHYHKLDLLFLVFDPVCRAQIYPTIQSKSKQNREVFQRHSSETDELLWSDLAIPVYYNNVGQFHSIPQLWWAFCRNEAEFGIVHWFVRDIFDLASVCYGLHLPSAFGHKCVAFLVLVQWHLLQKDFIDCVKGKLLLVYCSEIW